MSWDVHICKLKTSERPNLEELKDSDCLPLGPAKEVREKISALVPGVNWSDPTWGILDGGELSIEFNVGKDDPIDSFMLHVRGGGDAIPRIMAFCRPLGWSALDISTGEFLDPAKPSQEGWEGFQAFRDQIFKKPEGHDTG